MGSTDQKRRNFNGVDYALTTDLGSAGDHIIPLAEDAFAEADPITDYPDGISIMPISDTANWDGNGANGVVVTHRAGTEGWQDVVFEFDYRSVRRWDSTNSVWFPWLYPQDEPRKGVLPLNDDQWPESQGISYYVPGLSVMSVSAGANWGPNSGEAGQVVIEASGGSTGSQQFYTDNGKMFFRAYSGSWGSWVDVTTVASHAATHTNGTDDIQNATASQKGLATAAQITKLDGIESGATADQTAAEILTAIKTVDGTGSGLDADLLDGQSSAAFASATGLSDHLADTSDAHDASAISILDAAVQYTATDVEAALAEVLDGLQVHEADTSDAHDASAISFVPTGTIAATNVQSAIAEVASEAGGGGGGHE